ncbi:MAG TPA: hypothetical protein EYP43_03225 [Thermoplasmata archaeon]|nr:hypothetical protein [Thermoplasmata archaeon]
MVELREYECVGCGRRVVAPADDTPECCGRSMSQLALEPCTVAPADAEQSRPMDAEDACDDFRGG